LRSFPSLLLSLLPVHSQLYHKYQLLQDPITH
jgi:hypothetical protein